MVAWFAWRRLTLCWRPKHAEPAGQVGVDCWEKAEYTLLFPRNNPLFFNRQSHRSLGEYQSRHYNELFGSIFAILVSIIFHFITACKWIVNAYWKLIYGFVLNLKSSNFSRFWIIYAISVGGINNDAKLRKFVFESFDCSDVGTNKWCVQKQIRL